MRLPTCSPFSNILFVVCLAFSPDVWFLLLSDLYLTFFTLAFGYHGGEISHEEGLGSGAQNGL